MASVFIEQMTGEFQPQEYTDAYREALEAVVQSKLSGAPVPQEPVAAPQDADVVDLVAALRASVEAAKKRRAEDQQDSSKAG